MAQGFARRLFPPPPIAFKGRAAELKALSARLTSGQVQRLALVGGGGSGKSLLACALGHRLMPRFPGGAHWLRVGAWDLTTLMEMFARRLGVRAAARVPAVRARLAAAARTLVVLDNHESDAAMARFLDAFRGCDVTWIITARRCLLSGVELFPVVPPLAVSRGHAFPRVARLTRLLRWNPLALDIADALVATRAVTVHALEAWLRTRGVERVTVMDHEDDIVEARLILDWVWERLPPAARRLFAALAHCEGDDIDRTSLFALARVPPPAANRALALARRWHLVQEPLADRFTLHAVVRHVLRRRTRFAAHRFARHYVRLLEHAPWRVDFEQTHLFAAMDDAHRRSDLGALLRIERLLARLDVDNPGKSPPI